MRYGNITTGRFLSRENRFTARAALAEGEETVHVKNTGRLRELLLPGAAVYLAGANTPGRRTAYDLIAVEKDGRLFNIDSSAPNALAAEWIAAGGLGETPLRLRREAVCGKSRFDFFAVFPSGAAFIEAKGVTLEENGVFRFPDAPTERGLRHVEELIRCRQEGFGAWLLFVIQCSGAAVFEPNRAAQPAFADALLRAERAGVKLQAFECAVSPDAVVPAARVPIRL